ncbi:putative OsmC-like protein [Marinobacterium halophilum]|uniref:Putative OsmC-like protein n=1 Tax=Marinobacterium halophilum TaxID=267374 RepID=A0A2P8ETG4_9GAMM|nr:OsmC family protein [Marinobacterium halophilum]PSL12728.1 putative OsmC-like protein [Marinobacterium halophilum]
MSANKRVAVNAEMNDGFLVSADIRGHHMSIDQPEAARGSDQGPTPLEYFLFSLGGCICTIGRIAAMQQKLDLRSMKVSVEGDYNPAGLLGKPCDDRTGFQQIQVSAEIDADMTDEEKQVFLDAVCERCPLHDNIRLETRVTHQLAAPSCSA